MPRKKTPVVTPAIDLPQEFLEKLIPGPMDAAGVEAVFQRLKKAVIERALGAELGLHLADVEGGRGNHRNGRSGKTVLTDEGPLRIDVPRDRAGSFEPQLIPKHERRFAGFDERIVSMYARGMTVREIQGHLAEMYSVEVSPEFISKVTDEVMAEVVAWQARPLEAMYPVVFLGSTPKSRTVVKGLKTSNPALQLFAASLGCGTALCIQTHRLWLHRVLRTSCGRRARA